MKLIELLKDKAVANGRKVVLPEAEETAVVLAAYKAYQLGICAPILIGAQDVIEGICKENDLPTDGWYTREHPDEADLSSVIGALEGKTNMDAMTLEFLLAEPLYFGAALVATGAADGMVAGYVAETAEVISSGMMLVGLKEGSNFASAYFIMDVPGLENEEGGLLVYADAGATIDPNAQEMGEIAVVTADTIHHLLGWEPRVAMLSFSTKGSASHDRADKVIEATAYANELNPDLLIDGEMQADAALVPAVAAKKIPGGSPVGGRANILVFPDLDSGNIAYKLTQRLTGGKAYGPLLQGFAKPVCDLSRGSTVDDILGVITVVASM